MKRFLNLSNCILAIYLLIFLFTGIMWFTFNLYDYYHSKFYKLYPSNIFLIVASSFLALLLIVPAINSMIKKEDFKEYLSLITITLLGFYFSFSFFSGLFIVIHHHHFLKRLETICRFENIAKYTILTILVVIFLFYIFKKVKSFSKENSFK